MANVEQFEKAVTEAGAVVGTNARELRDLGLNCSPGDVGVTEAGVENHGGDA